MAKIMKLLVCQTCGMEKVRCFCTVHGYQTEYAANSISDETWNARQFKARHEAIDRVVLAAYSGLGPNRMPKNDGERQAINSFATEMHDANLSRRRAEAGEMMKEAQEESNEK